MRRLFKIFFILVVSPPILVLALHWSVGLFSSTRIYDDISSLPTNEAALVLGTSKYVKVKGETQKNLFYSHRLAAASELYKKHKVKKIIVSGDNSTKYYNEPKTMRADLMAMGIPSEDILIDNYGVRTYDSVLRARELFGEGAITVVSQKFHTERAVFIARWKGINAVAYNADDVPNSYGPKVYLREIFARTKMMMDLIGGAEPEYSGN
jgi:SanA protein